MTGAAKNVLHLVADEILDGLARGAEVFARVEFLWVFKEYLADAGGHGHAQVGVYVHLGATHAACYLDVRFGHALGVGHLASVFVDLGNQMLGHAGSAV